MCHDFSTISRPKKPTVKKLSAQNMSAMRNQEKTQLPFYSNHPRNMRSPVSQQGPWMKPRGTVPILPGMPPHPIYTLHNDYPNMQYANNKRLTPNMHYANNRRLTPTMTNRNNSSPRQANNSYRRRAHSETLPTRTPSINVPKYNARVSLLASPTQFAKHHSNNACPKVKTVAVPLTCEEVEAQASRGKFKGPLTCDEVELLQASSVLASAQQPERPRSSSPTPSSSSGYESITGLLSVIIGDDDQSDISSPPSSPMSDSVFCNFDQMPVMQSSPNGKTAPSSTFLRASLTPSTKEEVGNLTLGSIYNPDDDGYSSSDSVDKFLSVAGIGNNDGLNTTPASNDTKSSNSDIQLPSSTDNWQTSVEAVGLPCQFLSSKDTMKNSMNMKSSLKTTTSNKNKKGKKVSNAMAFKTACGVMPTICSSPPQAANLPLPPNMWVKPTTEPSSLETNRVDVTGYFTTILSRTNSPVASSTDEALTPVMVSSNIIDVSAAIEGSSLESMCSGDGGLDALFSSLDIQTRDSVMSAELYNRDRNISTNDCALEVLKQNLHGIHRNFNLLCSVVNHGTVAA